MTNLREGIELLFDVDAHFVAVESRPLAHGDVEITSIKAVALRLASAELLQLILLAHLQRTTKCVITKHQTCHAKIGDGYQTVEPSQWSKRSQMANAQGDQLHGSVSHGSLFGLLVGISGNENQFVELRLFKV